MQHAWVRREMYTKFCPEKMKGRDHSKDPDVINSFFSSTFCNRDVNNWHR